MHFFERWLSHDFRELSPEFSLELPPLSAKAGSNIEGVMTIPIAAITKIATITFVFIIDL
jgi:hypothetical protein